MIHYHCRHCEVVLGTLPLRLKEEALSVITQSDEEKKEESFFSYNEDGTITVYAICEQCERTLQQSPHYYALEKWLQ